MPKAGKMYYYAVKKGRNPGVYTDWPTAEAAVKGFTGAQHKKFTTEAEAHAFLGNTTTTTTTTKTTSPNHPKPYQAPVKPTTSKRGVHKEDDVQDESKWDVVYTDGACTNNGAKGAKAGIGVWFGHDDPRNLSERCPGDQTNNRAELIALIRALETAAFSDKPLLLKTDSSYSIQCVRDWLPRWRRNNYRTSDNKPVKNIEVILFLSHLLEARPGVRLQHIKGHAGHEGNEGADRLAVRGTWDAVLSDRDWLVPADDLPVKEVDSNTKTKAKIVAAEPSADEYAQYADCLLDDDEMERIGREEDF